MSGATLKFNFLIYLIPIVAKGNPIKFISDWPLTNQWHQDIDKHVTQHARFAPKNVSTASYSLEKVQYPLFIHSEKCIFVFE